MQPISVKVQPILLAPRKGNARCSACHSTGGGKHWHSQNDPEWQTLAAWVRGARS